MVDADRAARDLLHHPLAALGPRSECTGPGGADRYAGAPRVLLLHRDLAPRGLLPDRSAAARRPGSVPGHQPVRPDLVRLHLSADGVDRSVHVGRTQGGRRARPAHGARPRAVVRGQGRQEERQARDLAVHLAADRRRVGDVLQRCADHVGRVLHRRSRHRGLLLRRPVHLYHLPAGRLGARAGVHLYVPVAALSGRFAGRGQHGGDL